MNKKSLEEMKDIIINGLDKSQTIDALEKVELMLNLSKMLENEETYEKSIKVLKKAFKRGNEI